MATNKNASIRYKILDECFSNFYKKFFIEDLIEVCSNKLSDYLGEGVTISRRQILDDISFMKSEAGFEAPIETIREGKRGYYRYSDINFSILKKPLTHFEIEALKEALLVLGRIKNIEQFFWVDEIQAKLQFGLDDQKLSNQIMSFDENEHLKGIHFLETLYQFILNKQNLEIVYQAFNKEEEKYILSPYFLKQYNGRWFLLAWNHQEQNLYTFALDRIKSIELNSSFSFKENKIDFEQYFEEIIGVTNYHDTEVKDIVLWVSDDIIPYIETKPIHSSQKSIKNNTLRFRVKLNYELESIILSYGEKIYVLEPIELRKRIKDRIDKMQINYSMQKHCIE